MAVNKISVIVTPNSKVDDVTSAQCDLFGNQVVKIKTTAPAKDGKANKRVVQLLASHLKLKESSVRITSGLSTRNKIVAVTAPITEDKTSAERKVDREHAKSQKKNTSRSTKETQGK